MLDVTNITTPKSAVRPYLGMPFPINLMNSTSSKVSTMNGFVASMDIIEFRHEEDETVKDHVGDSKPSDYIVIEDQVFSDKKAMKKTVALYAIHKCFHYRLHMSDKREHELTCRVEDWKWKFGQTIWWDLWERQPPFFFRRYRRPR